MTPQAEVPWAMAEVSPRGKRADQFEPTVRELELVDQIARGNSLAEAGSALGIAGITAKNIAVCAAKRWSTGSQAHLVGEAFGRGYLIPVCRVPLPLAGPQRELVALRGCEVPDYAIAAEAGLSGDSFKHRISQMLKALSGMQVRKLAHAVALWHCAEPAPAPRPAPYLGALRPTREQVQAVELLAAHYDRPQLAAERKIKLRSAYDHLARLRAVTSSETDFELVIRMLRAGLVTVPDRSPLELGALGTTILGRIADGADLIQIANELQKTVHEVWSVWAAVRMAFGVYTRLDGVVAGYASGLLVPAPAP